MHNNTYLYIMYKIYLKPGKEESLKRFHPWVFSGAIARMDGEPEEGEVVEVYTAKKEFIAKGHFQIGSIAVRVLTFRQDEASPCACSPSGKTKPSTAAFGASA